MFMHGERLDGIRGVVCAGHCECWMWLVGKWSESGGSGLRLGKRGYG